MKLFITAIASLFAGLVAHLLLIFFVVQDLLSLEDLIGVAVMTAGYALVVFSILYLPGLYGLRKRLRGCEPAFYFPLFAALGLTIPVAIAIGVMQQFGGVFSTGEAILFVIQFMISGAVFGAGFVWHSRKRATSDKGKVRDVEETISLGGSHAGGRFPRPAVRPAGEDQSGG